MNHFHRPVGKIKKKVGELRKNLSLSKIVAIVKASSKNGFYLNLVLIVFESISFFTSLYLLKKLIDVVAGAQQNSSESYNQILVYVTLAGITGVAYFIIRSFSAYVTEAQSTRVAEYVNIQIHQKAADLPLAFYDSPSYYDTLKRAMDSGSDKPALVITTFIEVMKNTATLIAIGTVLIVINWMLLPLLALFILPTLYVRLHYSRKLNNWRLAQTPLERKSSYYSTLITTDTAAKEIRSYGLGSHFMRGFVRIRELLTNQKLAINIRRTRLEAITTAVSNVGVFFCIGFIALKTVSGEASVGDITLFLVAFPQAFSILQNIASGISIIFQNSIYVNSIFELLELQTSKDASPSQLVEIPQNPGELKLTNLSFTYPHAEEPTLTGINLAIPAGKIIAIAGLNGAGKSTLIKLLCRLYDPSQGSITLDGVDIRNFSEEEYKKMIAVVFQDFNKYAFTVAENIHFGNINEPFDEHRAREAAQKSGAASFVEHFPAQYNTVMGRLFEDGHEVSVGQWQKLALARCFYSDAKFLILDEATSAQDAASEAELFDTLREKLGHRTAVVISHRHSSLKNADYIYFIMNGSVIEEGTDDELMKQNGFYNKLFIQKAKAKI